MINEHLRCTARWQRAWVYAEELLDIMSTENGVDYFLEWIQTRFMEVEMSKISQTMNDLFRRCKKRPDQTVRYFNVEFGRMVLRLHEVRCELPPLVKAWLHVDKLKLTESQELSLLASCNNEFDCRKLQQAGLIQDRALWNGFGGSGGGPSVQGKGWKGRWKQSVHMTMNTEDKGNSEEDDEPNESENYDLVVDERGGPGTSQRLRGLSGCQSPLQGSFGKGTDADAMKRQAEERLRLAKQRSYCSACKRRGHWHKDDIRPLRQKTASGKGGNQKVPDKPSNAEECHAVTHACFMTHGRVASHMSNDFLAIVDTACTKSVAGYPWFEQVYKMSDALDLPYEVIEEKDSFKFGASRVFE